jgi:hypothetical protein
MSVPVHDTPRTVRCIGHAPVERLRPESPGRPGGGPRVWAWLAAAAAAAGSLDLRVLRVALRGAFLLQILQARPEAKRRNWRNAGTPAAWPKPPSTVTDSELKLTGKLQAQAAAAPAVACAWQASVAASSQPRFSHVTRDRHGARAP